MRFDERQRVLTILKDGFDNGGGAVHGDGVVRSPLADFTCPKLLAEEQRAFFRETPLFMGLSADLPQPGSYWADSQTGVAVLMTRDEDGAFHAFANSCRHRGAQVVADGRGRHARFSCPFHAWTYNLRGDLIAINREQRFGNVDKACHGLIELPAAERHGTLWVLPSPGGEVDLERALGGLQDDLEHWNLPAYRYGASQVLRANVNWKLAIDTFGENYHFDVLHRESLSRDIRGNLQTHDVFGNHYRMVFAKVQPFEKLGETTPDVSEWPFLEATICVYFLYPNAILLVEADQMEVLRIFPDENRPGRSRTAHSIYLPEEARRNALDPQHPSPDFAERFKAFNNVILSEDYAMAESTQRSAEAGIQSHMLFGRNEPALLHYHNVHRRHLGRPLLAPEAA